MTSADDVVAMLSGQQVDWSARRQLTRLHGLVDRLAWQTKSGKTF
jgi:hypothetical protein